ASLKVATGASASESFVSCISRTSGFARPSHQTTFSSRAFSELTFQVAIRIVVVLRSLVSLPRADIEAGRASQLGPALEELSPRGAGDAIGVGDDRRLVHREHAAVAHDPSAVHHDRLDVAGHALAHEPRDLSQRGAEMA